VPVIVAVYVVTIVVLAVIVAVYAVTIVVLEARWRRIRRAYQSKAAAKTADFDSKLGIGVHELRESRVTLYAVTIFCIPVTLGIAW
jgi:hypothetical protein